MNIAKIHVWKVPVLLYGDLADRVLIYIHGQGGRKEVPIEFCGKWAALASYRQGSSGYAEVGTDRTGRKQEYNSK